MKHLLAETLHQLKVILPLTALILLALLAWRGPAWGWWFCVDIGGGSYCWEIPDDE